MAEEKKTKSAPKKAAEEVSEKKFCTKCGKELSEGQTCNCSNETISINTDKIVGSLKGFWNLIMNMFKKPATTLKEETNKGNVKVALVILAVIALSYGLYMSGAFTSIIGLLGSILGENINNVVDIPYFKIFIYMTLIHYILAFVPITITFLVGKMHKNFDYKKSICLYTYSMVPTILTNILMAILYALNILTWLGAVIGLIVTIFSYCNYIYGCIGELEVSNDRKSSVTTGIIVVWVIVSFLFASLLLGSLIKDVAGDFSIKQNSPYGSYFDW